MWAMFAMWRLRHLCRSWCALAQTLCLTLRVSLLLFNVLFLSALLLVSVVLVTQVHVVMHLFTTLSLLYLDDCLGAAYDMFIDVTSLACLIFAFSIFVY